RGHSHHVLTTFSEAAIASDTEEVVNIGGGCGNLIHMLNAPLSGSPAASIADADTGQGEVTSQLVADLMVGMARGKQDWRFLAHYKNKGLVFPDDLAFRVNQYVNL